LDVREHHKAIYRHVAVLYVSVTDEAEAWTDLTSDISRYRFQV